MKSILLVFGLLASALAQAPGIRTSRGALLLKDAATAEIELGSMATAGRLISTSTGAMGRDGQIMVGKMRATDMPEIAVVLTGCDATAYSIKLALFRTENLIGARMTSSVVDSGEMDHASFANFVSLHAGFMDASNTLGLRLEIDVDSMMSGSSCSHFQYEAVVTSVTGGFDNTFAFSGGSAVELTEFATGVDVSQIQRLADGLATELVAARARIVELETLTSDYTIISGLVDDITGCHGRGQMLGTDGSCRHAVPTCDIPTNLPRGIRLSFTGEAVPGTVAVIRCAAGSYDTSGGAACMRNGSWSPIRPQCVSCPSECAECSSHTLCTVCTDRFPNLLHGMCMTNSGLTRESPVHTCGDVRDRPSGTYWLNNTRITQNPQRTRNPYQAFCFNDNFGGWTRPAGGGWEILHVQAGGWGYRGRDSRKSNRELRNRANTAGYGMRNIEPPDLANPVTQYSQMGQNWVERSRENGWEWGKFMAKIYGDGTTTTTLHGQDNNIISMGPRLNMAWFFTSQSRGYTGCTRMPDRVNVSINGLAVGSTDRANIYGNGNSVGLANKRNDPCGQNGQNYINTWDVASQHTFRRIDGYHTDNSIRHLFSYSDTSASYSASRCTYCCWGCGSWREVVMWGARPKAD